VAAPDKTFVNNAAMGGMMEVELGKVAVSKAHSDDVKKFGQRMVDDHTKANDELKKVAASKSITLPSDMGAKHKAEVDKMSAMSGAAFDRAYMQMMVSDHKKDVAEFQKESTTAKDSDIKNFASTTLPTLKEHLQEAERISGGMKSSAAK
jgi:putative membrane protein